MGPLTAWKRAAILHVCYKYNPKPLAIIKLVQAQSSRSNPSSLGLFFTASIRPGHVSPQAVYKQHKPTNPPTTAQGINRGGNCVYSRVSWPLNVSHGGKSNSFHLPPLSQTHTKTNRTVRQCLWWMWGVDTLPPPAHRPQHVQWFPLPQHPSGNHSVLWSSWGEANTLETVFLFTWMVQNTVNGRTTKLN